MTNDALVLLECFVSNAWDVFMTVPVPGFKHLTFAGLLFGIFLAAFSIRIVQMALGFHVDDWNVKLSNLFDKKKGD